MALSSVGVALASSTKTLLYSSSDDAVTATNDGNAVRGMEIKNHSGSANDLEVYVAPNDGPELASGDSWPTNADTTRKGVTLEPGQSRQVLNAAAGRGNIAQVWARSAGATVSFGPIA